MTKDPKPKPVDDDPDLATGGFDYQPLKQKR